MAPEVAARQAPAVLSSAWGKLYVALVMAGFLAQALAAAATKSAVADELAAHLPSGILYWKTGRFAGGLDNPPLGQLLVAAGPVLAGTADRPLRQDPAALMLARIPVILLGAGIVLLVGAVAAAVAGPTAGAAALLAAACCPDLVAHSSVATLDVPATFLFFLSCVLVARAWQQTTPLRIVVAGLVMATGVLVKFTVAYPFLILPVAVLGADGFMRSRFRTALGLLLAAGFFLVVLSHLAYLGSPVRDPWEIIVSRVGAGESTLRTVGSSVARALSWVLPSGLVEGLLGKLGHGAVDQRVAYLLGEWRVDTFTWYYPVAILVKLPISILITALIGCAFLARLALRRQILLFGIVPGLAVLFAMLFVHQINIGVRHLLPALPVVLVLVGVGAAGLLRAGILGRVVIAAMGLWLLVSAIRITPDQLAYFNELAGGPEGGDAVLLDSNLDWGQDEVAMDSFAAQHAAMVNPRRPCEGLVVANLQTLHGLDTHWTAHLRWLRRLPHERSIGHTLRVYRVDETAMRAAANSDPLGPIDLALWLVANGKPSAALAVLDGTRPVGALGLAWTHARMEALLALDRLDDAVALIPSAADPSLIAIVEHRRLDAQSVPWQDRPESLRRAVFKALVDRGSWTELKSLGLRVLAEPGPASEHTIDIDAWTALLRVRLRHLRPSADPLHDPPPLLTGLPTIQSPVYELLAARPADLSLAKRLDRSSLLAKLGNEAIAMSELGASLLEYPQDRDLVWAFGKMVFNRKNELGAYPWPDLIWRFPS